MISMMSKGYCDEHGYEIQPLDRLAPIKGSRGVDIPYLGYVQVRMQIPGVVTPLLVITEGFQYR